MMVGDWTLIASAKSVLGMGIAMEMAIVDVMVNVHVKLGSLAPIVPVLKRPALMVA